MEKHADLLDQVATTPAEAAAVRAAFGIRTIPLTDLRIALHGRRYTPDRAWCAYTGHPLAGSDCVGSAFNFPKRRADTRPLPSPMWPGLISEAVDRVHRHEGAARVRRIFGKGVRQLQAELKAVHA